MASFLDYMPLFFWTLFFLFMSQGIIWISRLPQMDKYLFCSYFVQYSGIKIFRGLFHSFSFSVCIFSPTSTFVCPTEIIAFSDKANEFHDVNCEVVAVSVDSHFCHLAWINTPRKVEIKLLFTYSCIVIIFNYVYLYSTTDTM